MQTSLARTPDFHPSMMMSTEQLMDNNNDLQSGWKFTLRNKEIWISPAYSVTDEIKLPRNDRLADGL